MTKNRTVNFLTGPSIETLAELAIALSRQPLRNQPLRKANMEGSCWILRTLQSVGLLGWTTASIVLILLCCCCVCAPEMHLRPGCCARADPSLLILVPPSISKPPSISSSRCHLSVLCRPPSSLPFLPSSCVLSPQPSSLHIAKWPHAEPRSTTDNYL